MFVRSSKLEKNPQKTKRNIQIACDILDLKDLFVQAELGEMDNWQEDTNAWEDEADATWEAEEVLR